MIKTINDKRWKQEMTTYGYARCSTDDSKQDINRQKRELKSLGCVDEKNIYWEYESGTKADRIELNRLLDKAQAGGCNCYN